MVRSYVVATAITLGLLAGIVLSQGAAAKGLLPAVVDSTTNLVTDTAGALTSTPAATPPSNPAPTTPSLTGTVTNTVNVVTTTVDQTVSNTVSSVVPSPVASPVTNAVDQATQTVNSTVNPVISNPTTQSLATPVDQAVQTVGTVVQPITQTVQQTTQPVTDTVTQVTQPLVNSVGQTVQQTVSTVDAAITQAPPQVVKQVGNILPVTQPVVDAVTPLLPSQPAVQPLLDNANQAIDKVVDDGVVPLTSPILGGTVGDVTAPTRPASPDPTAGLPGANPPATGAAGLTALTTGQRANDSTPSPGSLLPSDDSANSVGTANIKQFTIEAMESESMTPGVATDSAPLDAQPGLPASAQISHSAAPATVQTAAGSTGSVALHDVASGWATKVQIASSDLLAGLARAATHARVSGGHGPAQTPAPAPTSPVPSLPAPASSSTAGASSSLLTGSSGTAGFAAVLMLLIAALAVANRSYITRALQFPASIAYPVPVSPA